MSAKARSFAVLAFLLLFSGAAFLIGWRLVGAEKSARPRPSIESVADDASSPDKPIKNADPAKPHHETHTDGENLPPNPRTVTPAPTPTNEPKPPAAETPQAANPATKPQVPSLRFNPGKLSWKPADSLPYRVDASAEARKAVGPDGIFKTGVPEASDATFPENSLIVLFSVRDAVTGIVVDSPGYAEVVDQQGRLRAAGKCGNEWEGGFCIPYTEDENFIAKVRVDAKVGFITFGTAAGAPNLESDQIHYRTTLGEKRRVRVHLVVFVWSKDQAKTDGTTFSILDSRHKPIEGASLYRLRQILGQSDAHGSLTIILTKVTPPYSSDNFVAAWAPGKVPVFLKLSEVQIGAVNEIVLPADEHVLKFTLALPADTPLDSLTAPSAANLSDGAQYRSDRGIFRSRRDAEVALASRWGYQVSYYDYGSGYGNTDPLAAVLDRPWQLWWAEKYNQWYIGQWTYDPATGQWEVVVPHAGIFIIAPHQEFRRVPLPDGTVPELATYVMYPGVLIDATDPENPKAELICPR